jgi:methionine sulfoxide reductase heme-binding subunit
MTRKGLASFGLVVLRSALAAAAIYYSYRYLPTFFEFWDTEQPIQWWASRATGFAAYVTLALAMLFGLLVSSRGLDGAVSRKTVTDYHQQWTLAALVFTVAHVLVIVTDKYVDISVVGALVPGRSAHLTGEVAIGTLSLWGMVVIIVSSWARSHLSYELWRMIHAGSTAVVLLGLAHGVMAGADSDEALAQWLYIGTGAGIFGATVFRLTYEFRKPKAERAAVPSKASPSAPPPLATSGQTFSEAEAGSGTGPALVLDMAAARAERARLEAEELPPRMHGRRNSG